MPAGRGDYCESCYWEGLFHKRTDINAEMLNSSTLKTDWRHFCDWLQKRRGSAQSAILLSRYIQFFYEIDLRWDEIPSYEELLEEFEVDKLRRVRNVITWMSDNERLIIDSQLKHEIAEQRRIERYFDKLQEQTKKYLLVNYYKALLARKNQGKLTLRSVRLALCPAYHLLSSTNMPITQMSLDHYLSEKRGQTASISGFVTFLRENYDLNLSIRNNKNTIKNRKIDKLEKELITLIKNTKRSKVMENAWIAYGLEYFHLVPKRTINQVRDSDITNNKDESYTIQIGKHSYWLPPRKKP